MSKSIHNEMAEFAYKWISKEIRGQSFQKEFRSLARSFPSMIQVNGLGAATAFLFSKKGGEHKAMYQLTDDWTKRKFGEMDCDLMQRITKMDSKQYRLYTRELMNLCLWVKRFAEGLIENDG